MLREAAGYTRMALGICKLVRAKAPEDPEALLRSHVENREAGFLETARRVIFERPENPYHQMFRVAGCAYGDLTNAVCRDGLEAALGALHRQGVYLTHDEFKNKTPLVRSGQHIRFSEKSLVNPLTSGLIESRSSGSRSEGTSTRQSLRCSVYRESYEVLIRREFGLDQRALVSLKPILPSSMGIKWCVRSARLGSRVERWFAAGGGVRDSGHYRAATSAMIAVANLAGAGAPYPIYLPPNDFSPAAEWIAGRKAAGISCAVSGFVSPSVRVASAALEKGLDIRGTLFLVGGEALTDAKRSVIEAAGAKVFPCYWIHEVGPVGHACRRMRSGNCVHLFRDSVAVVSRRRRAPLSDVEVDSLCFTTLLPFSPRVLINAEMDDSGVIERVPCDCAFSAAGYMDTIRDIASFGKLTGHGVTLVGTDVVRVLEEVLPARLGGRPGDYQLVEHEGTSQTQLALRVSPRVGVPSPEHVKAIFLEELRRLYGGSLAARLWTHAQGMHVIIGEPMATASGKVLTLHLLGSAAQISHEPQNAA